MIIDVIVAVAGQIVAVKIDVDGSGLDEHRVLSAHTVDAEADAEREARIEERALRGPAFPPPDLLRRRGW